VSTTVKLSIAALALTAGLVACGTERSSDASDQDLQRDLQLADATTMNLATPRVDSALLNSMETKPLAAPQPTKTVRKSEGTRAVQSEAPTVMATPDVDVAALDDSEVVETESVAPVLEESSEPVAVAPRPAPVVVQAGGAGDYGTGGGIFGGGRGGVVIRGGGVDGDNCELHRGRGGVHTSRPGIYIPAPRVPQTGGIFTGRAPAGTRTIERPSSRVTTSAPRAMGAMRARAR
jgi:hypothetical protein